MTDNREATTRAQDAITKDESAIRAQTQEWINKRQIVIRLIEALDKAIKANRPKDNNK